jgi:hypothetical protein
MKLANISIYNPDVNKYKYKTSVLYLYLNRINLNRINIGNIYYIDQ